MEEIRGYVQHIIYRNNENGYTVFEVNSEGEEITCTGTIAAISEGESCHVTGEYVNHPVYGQQLRVSSYETCVPESREAVYRYLSSGAIHGIGDGLAKRIVQKFGDDTMRILDEEPGRLEEVKGISERMAREIAAQVEEKRDIRDAMIFLQQYGITNRQAIRIWDTYGMEMYAILRENPYRLAEDIDGIGFVRADEIASRIGIRQDSDFRIRSGLLYVLSQGIQDGSCYLPRDLLVGRTCQLLQVPEDAVSLQLDNLAMDRKVIARTRGDAEEGAEVQVYLPSAYHTEQVIAQKLLQLDQAPARMGEEEEILRQIRAIEEEEDIVLDDLQRQAVLQAAEGGVLLLSGGPGTGKTTTINTIIHFFISNVKAVLLAAPTGRAAKRMTEASGYEAMTIHRLLECHSLGDGAGQERNGMPQYQFDRNEDNPLEADVVIIDEMSMVDIYLFAALLRAVRPGTRLIMVGDRNQLPSVGPGKVLQDLIASGAFRTVMLEKVFRQAAQSDIIMNAHRLLQGEDLVLDNHSRDFFFLERSDPQVIYKHIVLLMTQMLPKYADCESSEIQVLTPMRKGPLGSIQLNAVLQSVLNPAGRGRKEYRAHDTLFREGDKVMQMKNNYEIGWEVPGNFNMPIDEGTGIFNGDFGTILSIDERMAEMRVRFDDNKVVRYPFGSLDDLELAYVITVHKSQGSEYPAVILPILSGPRTLFTRNLLYTAITRAKKCVVILGREESVRAMAANIRENIRYTGLKDRILEMKSAGLEGAG